MVKCSDSVKPQGAEAVATRKGYAYLMLCGLKIIRAVHDGKTTNLVTNDPPEEFYDLWHATKLIVKHYNALVEHDTKCDPHDSKEVKAAKMAQRACLKLLIAGLIFHIVRCVKHTQGNIDLLRKMVRAYALHLSGNHSFCFDTTKGLSSLGHASCAGTPAKLCSEDVTYIAHFIDSPTVQDPLPSIIYGLDTSSVESFWNVATQYRIKTTNYIYHYVNMMLAYLDWNWCVHQLLFLHQCTPLQRQKAKGQVSVQVQDPRVEEEENTYQQDSSGAKVLCFPVQVDGRYVPQVGGLVLGSSCGVGGR